MDIEKILALEPMMISDPNFRATIEELRAILSEEPAPPKRPKRKRKEDK